jgi:hypothetical protein
VTVILADHNMEGQAALLWSTIAAEGWPALVPLEMVTFADVGLAVTSTDRIVWRFAQAQQVLLLTNNRNATGEARWCRLSARRLPRIRSRF